MGVRTAGVGIDVLSGVSGDMRADSSINATGFAARSGKVIGVGEVMV